jgi:hypothetical protein
MAWAWRYEGANGQKQISGSESFANQSDAESWLGQSWRELVAAGVVTAVLVEDERVEYRMSLLPAGE